MHAPEVTWNGAQVSVTARLVPRYAWMTASIDVLVDGEPIIRTGGVLKLRGDASARFTHNGREHSVQVRWGRARWHAFPVQVMLDEQLILETSTPVNNWWLSYWLWLLPLAVVLWNWYSQR